MENRKLKKKKKVVFHRSSIDYSTSIHPIYPTKFKNKQTKNHTKPLNP